MREKQRFCKCEQTYLQMGKLEVFIDVMMSRGKIIIHSGSPFRHGVGVAPGYHEGGGRPRSLKLTRVEVDPSRYECGGRP